MNKEQTKKAEEFLSLHYTGKLLILPNIWDPLGALILQQTGFPAAATASAAIAFSLGSDDGEKLSFETMLKSIRLIASSVAIPVTADIEAGYAENPAVVAENIKQVIRAGAVGINIEDSYSNKAGFYPVDLQCERINAIRKMAGKEGIHLVINARTDVNMNDKHSTTKAKVEETIKRLNAYSDAGADCVYPVMIGDKKTLIQIRSRIKSPINVYASPETTPMKELEEIGINRLSIGPGMLRASATTMKMIATELLNYGSYKTFTSDSMSSKEIRELINQRRY
jgi:2-methylisocitrate lyase-like PEP mutase family enzyme